MDYGYLRKAIGRKSLPLMSENECGEAVLIERKSSECYKVSTSQNNGWLRINYYWADGTVEETYER